MTRYRTFTRRLPKPKRTKTTKKRLAASNIAQRYGELVRLRETLKAEALAR